MNAADFQSGHDRRHNDPPSLWLAVLAGSLVVHLLLLLSGRLFLFRVNSQKPAGVMAPIELVDISPKSSNKTTRSTRSSASNVITAPAVAQRAVSSETASQSAAPIPPSIIQSPIPRPTLQIKPSIRPTIKPSIAAAAPKSQPSPSVRPIPPTVPETIAPEQPNSPNPDSTSTNTGDRSTVPDANSPASSGSTEPDNSSSGVPNPSTSNSGKEPIVPGPISSNQTLSSELSVESTIGKLEKVEASPSAGDAGQSGSATLPEGSSTQILSIQFPPALRLAPNQVIDLTVLVTLDNTSGKVMDLAVLPESKAFQEISGLNQDNLNSVVKRVFQNLTFVMKLKVEQTPQEEGDMRKYSTPVIVGESPWKVPVKITVIK
jgi:hypothetical protein